MHFCVPYTFYTLCIHTMLTRSSPIRTIYADWMALARDERVSSWSIVAPVRAHVAAAVGELQQAHARGQARRSPPPPVLQL